MGNRSISVGIAASKGMGRRSMAIGVDFSGTRGYQIMGLRGAATALHVKAQFFTRKGISSLHVKEYSLYMLRHIVSTCQDAWLYM